MIVNGLTLRELAPIVGMESGKRESHGVSYGLGEAGYDIRIKQSIMFVPNSQGRGPHVLVLEPEHESGPDGAIGIGKKGRFALASAIEQFQMPPTLVGIVHDKSTWARRGLSVFNTVIEPGWKGFLTLELIYHGEEELIIPAGAGIAQVVFHQTTDVRAYSGKYQHQDDRPVPAILSEPKQ